MKPLNKKAYGSIPHLPGSKRGVADKGLTEHQAKILVQKCRKGDLIIVQEKLDGSNVAIAKIDNQIVPLVRAGYRAESSKYEQHHLFAKWVLSDWQKWDNLLDNGERLCGEWLAMAHGTQYDLSNSPPFFAFDLIRGNDRALYHECMLRFCFNVRWAPCIIHQNQAISIEDALEILGPFGLTGIAKDRVEGAVWRVEREGRVDFLGKFVRQDFVPGRYFDSVLWNWSYARS